MNKWILYTAILGVAVYWASNLLLWFPWSYSTTLGMTLMLTVAPVLWAYVIIRALKSYPKMEILKGALIIAGIFLFLAVIMDYLFFGLIRNAMDELYHPTTLYGYGFLAAFPFILAILFKRKILGRKRLATNSEILKAGIIGLICLVTVTLIIILEIEI
jgi:hypothetical protein